MSYPKEACIAAEMLLKEFLAEAKKIISKEAERCERESDAEGFVRMEGITPRGLEECVRNGTDLLQAVPFKKFFKKHTSAQWRNRWMTVVNSLLSESKFNVQTAYSVLGCGIDGVSLSKMERMLWMVHYIIVMRPWS